MRRLQQLAFRVKENIKKYDLVITDVTIVIALDCFSDDSCITEAYLLFNEKRKYSVCYNGIEDVPFVSAI